MILSNYTRPIYCLLALLSFTIDAAAQQTEPADASRWYQIEVFIYANNNPAAAREEVWPRELGLKYHEPLAVLTELDEQLAEAQEAAAVNSGPNLLADRSTAAPEAVVMPVPLLVLDKEQQQLNRIANNILRQADFRPLFHKAWRQPLTDRKNSEQIIILGGEQFDQHYELEGTISISVERYLHITTNLWFSTFTSNVGDNENLWPVLPAIPVTQANTQSDTTLENPDFFAAEPFSNSFSLGSEFQALTGNQYSVERTVTLRQHRRMRSNELHYLDHPLLGLLIKITPYEITKTASTAAEEQ